MGTEALIMVDNPEAQVIIDAAKDVYHAMRKHFGSQLSEEQFIANTRTLIGICSDIEFVAIYPKKVCEWFNMC